MARYWRGYDRLAVVLSYGTDITMAPRNTFETLTNCVLRFRNNLQLIFEPLPDANQLLRQHLAFTLFVPGGRADRAAIAIQVLTQEGLFDEWTWPEGTSPAMLADMIRPYVRFHNQKASRLFRGLAALRTLRAQLQNHASQLGYGRDKDIREYRPTEDSLRAAHDLIRKEVPGFGDKAAAHFMRNIGLFTLDFAYPIIDVHIHKALEAGNFRHGTYEESSTSFLRMASLAGLPPVLADAYIWCTYANNWTPDTADFSNFRRPHASSPA